MTQDQVKSQLCRAYCDLSGQDLISAAFVKAQAEMPTVAFDSENPFFKSKYASLAAIIGETRPILGKNGLAMHQSATIKDGLVTVATQIRHTSGQLLDFGSMSMSIGDTGKSEVQAAGSLITYLKRYSWQTALGIAADEDDDGNSAPVKPAKQPEQPKQATAQTRLWALNQLQAAPGQPGRASVTSYLLYRKWIYAGQQPEDWLLPHVPTTKQGIAELQGAIIQWEVDAQKPQEELT